MRPWARHLLSGVVVALTAWPVQAMAEEHSVWACYLHGYDEMEANRVEELRLFAIGYSEIGDTLSVPAFFEIDDRNDLLQGSRLTGAYRDVIFEDGPAFHAVFESARSGDRFDVISDMKARDGSDEQATVVFATIFSEKLGPNSPPLYVGECSVYKQTDSARTEVALRVIREQPPIIRVGDGVNQ